MSIFTVAQIIAKPSAGAQPQDQQVAVVDQDGQLTYAQLDERAHRLAGGLQRAGFAQGDRICVLMHNRLEWVETFFAVALLGGVVVPVNHLLTPPEIRHIVEDSAASWFVAEDQLWDRVDGLREILTTDLSYVAVGPTREGAISYESLLSGEMEMAPREIGVQDVFLLQYTSGTTGFPKGAIHTHSTVLWNAASQRGHFGVDNDTAYLCLPALSWVAGFHSLMLMTLWAGGRVVLNPTDQPFDPDGFCETVEQQAISHVALVPTVMRRVLAAEALLHRSMQTLRVVITGGESVPVHLMEQMNRQLPAVQVIQVYGMSEFPSLATLLDPADFAAKTGSAGRANYVSQVRVVDADDQNLPPGDVGEIVLRSPASMVGYHNRPDATQAALRGGWFHTGDLGYLDADGYLFIVGRSKDLVISGGLNIYPAEIEHALEQHPAVIEAAVMGQADDSWGEIAKAVVIADTGTVTEDELRAFLQERLARFKVPKTWEIRAGPPLPRTASGKLKKHQLAESGALPS